MKNKEYKWTYKRVLERFEEIEKKLNLDKSIIQGVPWWDSCRHQLFSQLLERLELEVNPNRNKNFKIKKLFSNKISNIFRILVNFIKFFLPKSSLWINKNSNIILSHPRKKFEEGLFIDPYTDPFIDLFPKLIDFSVIERTDGEIGHLSLAKRKNIFYGDFLYDLANIISKFKRVKFNKNDLLTISRLEESLVSEFSYSIDLNKKIKNIIKNWQGMYSLMRFFFRIKSPKILFIVVQVTQEALIMAAKSIGITTIELQHGSPARGKLVYDYTSGIQKKSFPDFFLSFGDYWSSNCKFPIEKKKIISFGYPYLYKKINSYSHIVKEDRLVIISKGTSELARLAQDINKQFSNKIIVEYKPHPIEFFDQEPDYFKELRKAGVAISDKHADLYEIFARSRWQVGVYSTALYEGLYFGVACFILNTPGSETMDGLVSLNLARPILSSKDIDLNWKIDNKNLDNIFSQPNKKKIQYIISLIK
tara:strand:- start:20 stop:1450 length:1431 start_codon:yes stop_codon:yes gene_type:complete